jgi:predicted AlkP superfamily pyrophosphatase or phosphodiesterase
MLSPTMNGCRLPGTNVRRTFFVALGFALAALLAPASQGQEQTPPTLLLMISIDGLRPDYVTAADAHGVKIPHLRRFLKEGAYAEGVQGVVPTVTYPSHTTLVTGVWPVKHGILANTTFDPLRKNQEGWYWYSVAGDRRRTRELEHSGILARQHSG